MQVTLVFQPVRRQQLRNQLLLSNRSWGEVHVCFNWRLPYHIYVYVCIYIYIYMALYGIHHDFCSWKNTPHAPIMICSDLRKFTISVGWMPLNPSFCWLNPMVLHVHSPCSTGFSRHVCEQLVTRGLGAPAAGVADDLSIKRTWERSTVVGWWSSSASSRFQKYGNVIGNIMIMDLLKHRLVRGFFRWIDNWWLDEDFRNQPSKLLINI